MESPPLLSDFAIVIEGAKFALISYVHWPANPDTSAQRWTELVSKGSAKLGCSAWSILLGASSSKAVVTGNADP